MKHYLISLWNVDCYDIGWLERRAKVFEKFTLPSVEGQSNKNFEWLLISDTRTPDKFKDVLGSYPARVHYHDWEHHDWKYPKSPNETKLQFSVRIETIPEVIEAAIGEPDTDYIITSRLDNDDILAVEHMDRIQRHVGAFWINRTSDRFWFSTVRGFRYRVDASKMYPFNSMFNSFLSFVEPPFDIKSCFQTVHTEAKTTGYPTEYVRQGAPTWAEVIHGENVLNRVKRFKGEREAKPELGRFSL